MTPEDVEINGKVYARCYEAQGEVFKFAEVDLSLPREAMVHFECEDGSQYTETLPTDWSVMNLKIFVEAIFQIPPREQILFYGDSEKPYIDYEEIKGENIRLSRIGFKNNDFVIVSRKRG